MQTSIYFSKLIATKHFLNYRNKDPMHRYGFATGRFGIGNLASVNKQNKKEGFQKSNKIH
jgi:hypothetical protein